MEKYFVTSNGDSPVQLFFSLEDAEKTLALYIDIFNEVGLLVGTVSRLPDGSYI